MTRSPTLTPFHAQRLAAWLDRATCAAVLGVSERSVQRYERNGAPPPVQTHLELYAQGRIIPAAWAGWRFAAGCLQSPEGLAYRPGDLLAAHFQRQELETLRRRLSGPAQFVLL